MNNPLSGKQVPSQRKSVRFPNDPAKSEKGNLSDTRFREYAEGWDDRVVEKTASTSVRDALHRRSRPPAFPETFREKHDVSRRTLPETLQEPTTGARANGSLCIRARRC